MDAKCKMNGGPITWPCAAAACPLFGDCISEWRAAFEKPPTNADRIRAMSDEELAKILIGVMDIDDKIHFCKNKPECEKLLDADDGVPAEWCEACMREWLQRPAEEGGGS